MTDTELSDFLGRIAQEMEADNKAREARRRLPRTDWNKIRLAILFDDVAVGALIAVTFIAVFAILGWWRFLLYPQTWLWTLASLVCALGWIRDRWRQYRAIRQREQKEQYDAAWRERWAEELAADSWKYDNDRDYGSPPRSSGVNASGCAWDAFGCADTASSSPSTSRCAESGR